MSDVVVIGGGASGMMAAIYAARCGGKVTLFERNEKLGKKIYITGKGRCNVTNDCTLEEFMQEVPRNPRFLYSALSFFSPQDMLHLLEEAGCKTVVERGRRAFPQSQHASDVTKALIREMERCHVDVRLGTGVSHILAENGAVTGAELDNGQVFPAGSVIIACGGKSYPATGSTGDGYRMARELGHSIVPTHGVLSAMVTREKWCTRLQGLSLKNVSLTMEVKGKIRFQELGEMLFTHFGVSGPMVLTMSCHMPDDVSQAEIHLDMKPGLTPEQLDLRLQREIRENPMKSVRSVLHSLVPGSMADILGEIAGIDTEIQCAQFPRQHRAVLAASLKNVPLHITSLWKDEEAIITRGGVQVKEINPKTMESKLVSGLYFAGETIDVDAHTGGYNLQIAFSTGALAGKNAAMK